MTVKERFPEEKSSINFFIDFLKWRGFEEVNATQYKDKYCYYDVEAKKNDKIYRFELKRRYMTSTLYNDAVMEKYKLNKFIQAYYNGEINYGGLVSFFDDCFTVSNIFHPIGESVKLANKTTDFENKEIVEKQMVHYEQTNKYNYD